MLNSLRDGQISYGTPNCPSAHVPPHNVVAPIHQNSSSLMSTEPAAPVVYPWTSNPRLEHLYGFHSRYYNLDLPTSYYPPTTNQYIPAANIYGQNVPQCCQPCCRLRSQNIPKTSSPQPVYNPIRPAVQQLNRSNKSKKTLKTTTACSAAATEQFLPYIPNDLPPVKYDTQNYYQQKYSGSYLNNTNYCPPANNLWIPPAANPTWAAERLRPAVGGRHSGMMSHDFGRDKNYQRLPNYQSNNPYSNPTGVTHRPYDYIPPPVIPDVHDYHRPPVYHDQLKNNVSEYVSYEHNSRLLPSPIISSQNNQSSPSTLLQQYYNAQPVPAAAMPSYTTVDVQRLSEPFKCQIASQNSPKSNLNVREFLATWDEGEEEIGEKPSETTAPIVVLDCMTLEGDALTKVQEKLNVVSYENLEKVLKENQNPMVINAETNAIGSVHNKTKPAPSSKPNFEPLDYTKRETGIIKPFLSEKKTSLEMNSQSEKSYSVNFDGMVAWYGKKNTDISSTDLIERLADRLFNLSKSQENEGVSFGTASYTGQITQTSNRSVESTVKDPSKYTLQSHQQIFDLQHHTGKCIEPSAIDKISCDNESIPRIHSPRLLDESQNKTSTMKSNGIINSSCIVENMTKKCLNISDGNEETTPWNLDHSSPPEQHLNMSLYDHSVIMKPLDFSSLTDESKGNPFAFEKNTPGAVKPSDGGIINDQYNEVLNENNNYHPTNVSNSHHHHHHQHAIQQMDSSNRNFPVIVSPHVHRQEYNGFHESVIQRTGCEKSKHDKVSTTQPDFENMNWNISNDLDKIIKNTNIAAMEPSCMYDRSNNYNNMLDNNNMNSEKIVSTQWKVNVPCMDLTVNSKMNSNHHDSFFDGWNFIDTFENHSSKKTIDTSNNNNNNNNNNVVHSALFPNQMTSLEQSNNANCLNNRSGEKAKNETSSLVTIKDISFSKPVNMSSDNNNVHSRSVFNLNNRIPDFSDGFELSVMNNNDDVPHEYMQFKNKLSNDNENRTDGSIFEHLAEPKSVTRGVAASETTNVKSDHHHNNKSDVVGLPSFKEKEPLAPMPVPPKLNVVKPIIRDPSQIYTVIKQKPKYGGGNNPCAAENDNAVSNKTGGHILLRGNHHHQTSIFHNGTDLKSKYNNAQLNQFDVWSEKFVLKGSSNNSSSAVVQCDVEITQFKSTPENRSALIPKPNMQGENYHDKDGKLPADADCNLIADKMNVIGNDKINSNDFLNCLENAKINDQKYRDTLDEFETSFRFDIHCNNESNKSFHEDIVDKCLEETIKDKIGEHNINTPVSTNNRRRNNTPSNDSTITSSDNNNTLPFQCNFQSSYLIKNYFDGNEDKGVPLEQKQDGGDHEKTNTNFNYHRDIENEFELQNNKNVLKTQNSEKNSDFNIILDINHDVAKQIKNGPEENNSNFINQTELKRSFDSRSDDDNTADISKISSREKNSFDYRNFEFVNNKKRILESTSSKEVIMDNNHHSNIHDLSNVQKRSSVNVDFENINSTSIFETSSNTSPENTNKTANANHELQKTKINFESTFHAENTGNIEHRINNKNIFEVKKNNSDLYQTSNLEKMHEFDFETRIIRNFDMECSNSNVQKPTSPIGTCINKNQTNTEYSYERNDTENKIQKETNLICALSIHKESEIEDSSGIDCNGNTQFNNVIGTENKNNKIDNVFDVTNTERLKFNLEMRHTDFNIQNDDTEEEINFNNSNNESSNTDINVEVENIFENLFDNLKTLNIEKDSDFFKNQNDDKCNVPENFENIGDQNLKTNNSSISYKDDKETKCHDESGESFEETNNVVLLQEFVNNSTSRLMSISSRQNQMSEEVKNNELDEFNIKRSIKHSPSKNENYIYIPKKTVAYENNNIMFKTQKDVDIKQNEIEMINQNNVQTIKNTAIDIVQGDTVNKTFENIEPDLFKLKTTVKPPDEECRQNFIARPHSSFNNVEHTCQENSDDLAGVEDSSSSDSSSSFQHMEFACQQDSKHIGSVENSISSGTSSLSHVDSTHQEHFNKIIEEDAINSEPVSLNDVEFTRQQDINAVVNVKDSTCSLNQVGPTLQEHFNDTNETQDLINNERGSVNYIEFTREQDTEDIVKVEGTSRSLNHVEPTHQKHFKEIVNVQDSINIEPTTLNDDDSKDVVEVENSISLECNSLNDIESAHQEHYNDINEANDFNNTKPCSLNDVEFTGQQDCKDIVEDSTSSECNSLNDDEPTHQEHYNDMNDASVLINTKLSSLSDIEFTDQNDSKAIFDVEDLTRSECDSINDVKPTHQEHYNDMIEADYSISSEYSSFNDDELTGQQNSNDMVEVKDTTCSLNHVESSTYQKHNNDMIEAKDSVNSQRASLNNFEFTCQQDSKDISEVEDSTSFELNSLNDMELTYQEHNSDMIEAEDSINTKPTLLNGFEFSREQEFEDISEVEESTPSLNHVKPTRQERLSGIIEAENSISSGQTESTGRQHSDETIDYSTGESLALSVSDVFQTNGGDSHFKNAGSESIVDDVTLPRVKFVLKCRTKSMTKINVFDEESTVPYKKRNAAKGENFIVRNVLKKRNNAYKPWQRVMYRKQFSSSSPDDPKELNAKPVTVAAPETASSRSGDVVENVRFDGEQMCGANRKTDVVLPAVVSADECEDWWRRDEKLTCAAVENGCDDAYERPFARDNEHTPMPSPFDEFDSESQTPEHGDGEEEYWDKSLENEYQNVLHKTISKLAKARVCCRVRDRFNTRLMARRKRRTNVTRLRKRRRRRRRLGQRLVDNAWERRIDSDDGDDCCGLDDGKSTAVKVLSTTKCKIKVQLPWGRIFNLNNREDGDQNGGIGSSRDTKLELGPAKVEVRLTRTPGEWQVAACESITSRRKSVVSVRRLVLQRAASPSKNDCKHGGGDDGNNNGGGCCTSSSSSSSSSSVAVGNGERTRKLPKIVIRRNGRDNNYTSYVRSGGGFEGGGDDEQDCCPRLMVRLVRNRKLDAMAADGITTLHLKHIVPIAAECAPAAAAATKTDTHGPKRVRYV